MRAITFGINSSYRNNDITAIVQDHHFSGKLIWAKSLESNARKDFTKQYQGIELGWYGEIPINPYIELNLGVTGWLIKAKNDTNQVGASLKASLSF